MNQERELKLSRSSWRKRGFDVKPGERGEKRTETQAGFERTFLVYTRSQVMEHSKRKECPF